MAPVLGFLWLLLPVIVAGLGQPQDSELTFLLPAGRQECFYQTALYNGSMEVEYQVIGGAGLDVDFSNSFSTISEKLVFFEIIFDSQQGDEEPDSWADMVEPDELLDIKMEDSKMITESIESMRARLERSMQMQTVLRAFEARDRNLQDSNLGRVNFWSAVNLAVLVTVAFLQVYMLKSLFDDRRKSRT
ncbi:PREDICTED: LOW QUALITY PROTEIN: transmembrane emp24 domain-containing protein 1 [Nanorana parkeri]|uniref:LOW QUALITY PROTEIN: transmembrane emp24 domain-containing protein 1 n=1 Tax=Nanorana parkeri TaxID=125878 RepID=UPI0008545113|nr:PREDICTED: LOW QUALITY PROTEIN: transmembrane emp24 domain-containing protein 1 [Nanorana parkeri]